MYFVLLTTGISAGTLLVFVLLFGIERRRGERFLPRFRTFLDRGVEALYHGFGRVSRLLGRDVVRHTIHYIFHRVLRLLRELFRHLERRTDALLRANKEVAKRSLLSEHTDDMPSSKLQEMVDHKADTALTPKEKRSRKEKSIGMRL